MYVLKVEIENLPEAQKKDCGRKEDDQFHKYEGRMQ